MRRARQLDPKDPRTYLRMRMESYGHFLAGRYDEAATAAKDGLNFRADEPTLRVLLAASLGNAGRTDEARTVLSHGELRPEPGHTLLRCEWSR